MVHILSKTHYYMRCLRKNLSVIGTVFEALIYQLDEIIMQFDKGISALTSEALV